MISVSAMGYKVGQPPVRRKRYFMIGAINAANDQVFFLSA